MSSLRLCKKKKKKRIEIEKKYIYIRVSANCELGTNSRVIIPAGEVRDYKDVECDSLETL